MISKKHTRKEKTEGKRGKEINTVSERSSRDRRYSFPEVLGPKEV